MAAGILVLAALALTRSGRRQRAHRGWPWIVAAMGAGALGAVLALPASQASSWGGSLVQALLLCWPILLLTGLRRFHARLGLPGHTSTDLVAWLLAVLALPWLPGPAVLALHLYVAALVWSATADEDSGALRLTGTAVALAALPVAFVPWTGGPGTLLAQALGAGPALLTCAFAALAAMADRSEHELRQSRRRLRVLASTDPLTGVANRRHFEDGASRLLRRSAVQARTLLLLDIDHFKQINDSLGHAAGDRALRLVGRCIHEALRAGDIAGRLGGDEFALMLADASLPQAMAVADRLVTEMQVRSAAQHLPMLSLSFGLVQMLADELIADALHRADLALYEAKRQGRSRAVAAHGDDKRTEFGESQRLGLTSH